jgi:protein tyrosine phosphatase
VCEFWSLVWEQAVPAIVMLTKNFDLVRVMCVQYWPRSEALQIQPFLGHLSTYLLTKKIQ